MSSPKPRVTGSPTVDHRWHGWHGWRVLAVLLLATLVAMLVTSAVLVALELLPPGAVANDAPEQLQALASPALIERGAYLARAGNCAACHTQRGGPSYAGGRAIETPFGAVFAGNLTPAPGGGLGGWQSGDFWRALHEGRSRDGRLLSPAFPYPHFTRISRADSDALWAHLRSQPAVERAPTPHQLRWPYGTQPALAAWRLLYFRAGSFEPQPDRSAVWNRGAYLVEGLGHCSACHAPRNAAGAGSSLADAVGRPSGAGLLPQQGWVAPSLTDPGHPGVAGRSADELVQLLKTGVSPRAAVMGPMAEVVAGSTQHLHTDDLQAMVHYLHSLVPEGSWQAPAATASNRAASGRPAEVMALGEKLYTRHCADCHGSQGQGAPGIYPPLAGNRTVTMDPPRNLLQAITQGGFPPATAGNPRPYGMPAFDLRHDELAALGTWLRASWGHDASALSTVEVLKAR